MAKPKPGGRELLIKFIDKHRLKKSAVAKALNVSGTAVFYWTRPNYPQVPKLEHRIAIETWTGGDVPASSWGASKTVVPFNAA